MRGGTHRHTIRAIKLMVNSSPTGIWCIQVRGHEWASYESPRGWFHMVILLHEQIQTQTHNQGLKNQGKWLSSTSMMYSGEGTQKSDLWELHWNGFTWWSLLHEGAQTQTHNQSPKNHGKWLPSMYMIYWGEWTWNSGLWKPRGWFHMVIPTPWGGTYTDTQSGS